MIIDRIENGFAVCELPDGLMVDIPLSAMPVGVKPGQALTLIDGEYKIDEAETVSRAQKISELERRLFGKK